MAHLGESLLRPYSSVEQAITELELRKGKAEPLVIMDRERRVIAVPKAFVYSCSYSPNPNQLKCWWYVWKDLPDCPQKIAHVPRILAACNMESEPVRKRWLETFGKVIATEFRDKPEYANYAAPLANVVQLSEHRANRSRVSPCGSPDDVGPGPAPRPNSRPRNRTPSRDVVPD